MAAGPDRARPEARELKGDLVADCDSTAFRVGKIEGSSKGQEGAREEAPRKVSVRSPCGADSLDGKAGIQGGGPQPSPPLSAPTQRPGGPHEAENTRTAARGMGVRREEGLPRQQR